jgi:hypothetical protein
MRENNFPNFATLFSGKWEVFGVVVNFTPIMKYFFFREIVLLNHAHLILACLTLVLLHLLAVSSYKDEI